MIVAASTIPPAHSYERAAVAAFLRGTACGWSKSDLASWLVCHYSPCLVTDTRSEVAELPSHAHVSEESIEQIILDARTATLRLLSDLAWPSQASVHARSAVARGHVIGRRVNHALTWSPLGRPRMRLADRVGSLLIADCMNSPHDYRGVALCRECSELSFDALVHAPGCAKSPLRAA